MTKKLVFVAVGLIIVTVAWQWHINYLAEQCFAKYRGSGGSLAGLGCGFSTGWFSLFSWQGIVITAAWLVWLIALIWTTIEKGKHRKT